MTPALQSLCLCAEAPASVERGWLGRHKAGQNLPDGPTSSPALADLIIRRPETCNDSAPWPSCCSSAASQSAAWRAEASASRPGSETSAASRASPRAASVICAETLHTEATAPPRPRSLVDPVALLLSQCDTRDRPSGASDLAPLERDRRGTDRSASTRLLGDRRARRRRRCLPNGASGSASAPAPTDGAVSTGWVAAATLTPRMAASTLTPRALSGPSPARRPLDDDATPAV